jgi:predicted ribosomally synthesized peptide with nif11-like leader
MSLDQARLFIEKMKSDEAFRNHIMAIENVEARLATASDAGFACTEAEITEVQSELSDEELDQASGGVAFCHLTVYCMGAISCW